MNETDTLLSKIQGLIARAIEGAYQLGYDAGVATADDDLYNVYEDGFNAGVLAEQVDPR